MKTIRITVLIAGTAILIAGCGGGPPDQIESVTVLYFNPFPPQGEPKEQSFQLTVEELKEFTNLCPDLNKTKGPGCPSYVPPFTFKVRYGNGKTIGVQFCGKSLRTFDPSGNLDAPEGLHEFLIKTIEVRAGKLDWGKAR